MYGSLSDYSLNKAKSLFDFARCVRPNGTSYGTAGTCRKGTKRDAPVEEKKARGMRIGKTVKSLSVADLEKLLSDPRIKPHQVQKVKDLIAEKSKGLKVTPDVKPPKATSEKKETAEPKESKKIERGEKVKEAPKAETGSKVTDERLRESYSKSLNKFKEVYAQEKELLAKGADYKDPAVRKLLFRSDRVLEAMETMRQAFYARDRDSFVKAAAARNNLLKKSRDMEERAREELEKDGLDTWSAPKGHRSKLLFKEADKLRIKANGLPEEEMNAAYYGEPLKISKPKSDGGGKVEAVVPPFLPRGGASKDLKDFLNGAEVVMAFKPKGFSKFVKEGVAKNAFEPGTGGVKVGRVKSYMEARVRVEENALKVPRSAKASERPVYAALEHPDRSRSLQGGQGMMSQYGGIQVIARPSVKDRATFTIGDSLDGYSPRGLVASPVRDPAKPSRDRGEDRTVTVNAGGGVTSSRFGIGVPALDQGRVNSPPYVEAQIFGGLKLSDVTEVRYYKGSEIPSATLKALNKAGIPVVELPPQMKSLKFESRSDIPEDLTTLTPSS